MAQERYQPCPHCLEEVDTWLAGTNVAVTNDDGEVLHAGCWLGERDGTCTKRGVHAPSEDPWDAEFKGVPGIDPEVD